jgi:hypothetical protein
MLARYGPKEKEIDFMSVDVEGGEIPILKSVRFDQYDIRVVVVEFDKADEREMHQVLSDKGNYRYVRQTMHNSVFVKTPADLEKMKAVSIDCRIEGQLHPKGVPYTTPYVRKERYFKNGKIIGS